MLHKLMLVSCFSLPWWSAGILLGTVCRPQAPTSVEPTEIQMMLTNSNKNHERNVIFTRWPSCSSIWEPPSLKAQSLTPTRRCYEPSQSSPGNPRLNDKMPCFCCSWFSSPPPPQNSWQVWRLVPGQALVLKKQDMLQGRPWYKTPEILI